MHLTHEMIIIFISLFHNFIKTIIKYFNYLNLFVRQNIFQAYSIEFY